MGLDLSAYITLVKYSIRKKRLTLRYSLVASCHSLVIDLGGGRAKAWIVKKSADEIAIPMAL